VIIDTAIIVALLDSDCRRVDGDNACPLGHFMFSCTNLFPSLSLSGIVSVLFSAGAFTRGN